jgi:two-component system, chemotaxis family, CheB/CheR fusion protein
VTQSGPEWTLDCLKNSLIQNICSLFVPLIFLSRRMSSPISGEVSTAPIEKAQNKESAKFPGMPESALASGNVDIVLPPAKIALELARISKHPYIGFPESTTSGVKKKKEIETVSDPLQDIFRDLLNSSGVDFSQYKLSTVLRRVKRRMVINKISTLQNYKDYIKKNKEESKKLYSDLLINVTSFFRDPDVYKVLNKKIFPRLIKNVTDSSQLRIWVPGCSTGEEVYSIAITLREFLESTSSTASFQIFATDISELSIEKARAGIFTESAMQEIPIEMQKKYFTKSNGMLQVNKTLRDRCIFARQDLIQDPPYSKIDLISCRNLLIYLSADLQKKIIPLFHYSLNPDGFLLLGISESIGSSGNLFQLIDAKNKLYKKKPVEKRIDYNFTLARIPGEKTDNRKNLLEHSDILKEADRLILSKYAPAALLINQNLDIIQFRGNIKQYLDPAPGNASLNLFKMINEGMNTELHSSIKKAGQTKKPVLLENIRISRDGINKYLDLEVVPFKSSSDAQGRYYLLLFIDSLNVVSPEIETAQENKVKTNRLSDTRIQKLKEELKITKDHLQSIIEEREGANEELRSALEELQSSNEELQSTNEEMETAREELQSTNEELITTNDELENRNTELNEINNDLNNLLISINTAIVLLGRDLRIRRYTRKAETIWNLIPGDIGRPISNIKPNFEVANLERLILQVMENFESKELEVRDKNNTSYAMKIRPYTTTDGKIEGAVISLYDVDARTKAMEVMTHEKIFYESVLNTIHQPLLVLDDSLKIFMVNSVYYNLFRATDTSTIGKSIYSVNNQLWDIQELRHLLEVILSSKDYYNNYKLSVTPDFFLGKRVLLNARRIKFVTGTDEYILIAIEVSDDKSGNEKIQ